MNLPPFPDDYIPASPEALSLTAISKLARVYCASYASPHHITFTVEGLRHFVEALSGEQAKQSCDADTVRDAERYRWIKARSRSEMMAAGVDLKWYVPTENLDAAIDAARVDEGKE